MCQHRITSDIIKSDQINESWTWSDSTQGHPMHVGTSFWPIPTINQGKFEFKKTLSDTLTSFGYVRMAPCFPCDLQFKGKNLTIFSITKTTSSRHENRNGQFQWHKSINNVLIFILRLVFLRAQLDSLPNSNVQVKINIFGKTVFSSLWLQNTLAYQFDSPTCSCLLFWKNGFDLFSGCLPLFSSLSLSPFWPFEPIGLIQAILPFRTFFNLIVNVCRGRFRDVVVRNVCVFFHLGDHHRDGSHQYLHAHTAKQRSSSVSLNVSCVSFCKVFFVAFFVVYVCAVFHSGLEKAEIVFHFRWQ